MNFERSLNKILYNLFSKNNFMFVFGVLLLIMFLAILYNNNNLIEGNGGTIHDAIKKSKRKIKETQNFGNLISKKTEKQLGKQPFIENMNCSDNYGATNNKSNDLVSKSCLNAKRLMQENELDDANDNTNDNTNDNANDNTNDNTNDSTYSDTDDENND